MASLATPETILRWYREQVAAKYDGSRSRGGPGRPATRNDKVQQLLTMARENPSWGYTRLRGALENLGFDLGRSTIQRILTEHGIEPAPLRGRTMPWKTFLKAHWGAIAAADFFSVEVLTRGGLVRYLVLFVIHLTTRRVHIAGVTCAVDSAWMAQVARNLTDAAAGPLTGFGHLIVDRDPLYTAHFRTLLHAADVQLLRLPANSPNLNAYAERFVRSIKHECLRHIVPLGERHLRAVVRQFLEHYHAERNHQGLGNVIPFPPAIRPRSSAALADAKGSVACSPSTCETPRESGAIANWDNTAFHRVPRFAGVIASPWYRRRRSRSGASRSQEHQDRARERQDKLIAADEERERRRSKRRGVQDVGGQREGALVDANARGHENTDGRCHETHALSGHRPEKARMDADGERRDAKLEHLETSSKKQSACRPRDPEPGFLGVFREGRALSRQDAETS